MFYIYILKSKNNNSYYIGSCSDLEKRLEMHNNGCVMSTKRYLPWEIIYWEFFESLKEARVRELQIKKWKSRRAVERLFNRGL